MPSEPTRQLVAIVFTDIVGYTRMMGTNEAEALSILGISRELHHSLAREHCGRVIKEMGDGQILQFNSASEALKFGIDLQQSTHNTALENRLRIGIHVGDVTHDNEDVFGDGVNISSRVQSLCNPGGIYLTEDIQHLVRANKSFDLKKLGFANLKNVDQPILIYAVQGHGLPEASRFRSFSTPKILSWAAVLLLILTAIVVNQLDLLKDDQIESITVVPFMSIVEGEMVNDHWSYNMTQSLMSSLGKISSIRSVYTNVNKPIIAQAGILEVGQDLGVDAILTGTISREGPMVTINTMLVSVKNEEIVWSETYSREVRNILKLQAELVESIIQAIEVAITPDELSSITNSEEVDAIGFEYLLKGQYHLYRINPEHYDSALYYFNLATTYDELKAEAYAGIALVWVHKGQWGGEAPLVAAQKAVKAYKTALLYDSMEEQALLAKAHVYTSYAWDWDSAKMAFEHTIKYNPNHVEPHLFYADLLVSLHENEKAFGHIDKAYALAPKNPFVSCLKGWVLFANHKFDLAEEALLNSLKVGYRISLSHRCLWGIYHIREDYVNAGQQAEDFYASQDLQPIADEFVNVTDKQTYIAALQRASLKLEELKKTTYVSSMRNARLYAFAGDKEQAINWLEKAYEEHYTSFFSLNVDPHWETLHDEPGFKDLVARVNLTLPRK